MLLWICLSPFTFCCLNCIPHISVRAYSHSHCRRWDVYCFVHVLLSWCLHIYCYTTSILVRYVSPIVGRDFDIRLHNGEFHWHITLVYIRCIYQLDTIIDAIILMCIFFVIDVCWCIVFVTTPIKRFQYCCVVHDMGNMIKFRSHAKHVYCNKTSCINKEHMMELLRCKAHRCTSYVAFFRSQYVFLPNY